MRRGWIVAAVSVALALAVSGVGLADMPQGPVTIVTEIDFSDFPFSGEFQVTEGAEILGCSAGTFIDHPAGFEPPSEGAIAKIFTCGDGGEGTFTANFQPFAAGHGHWNITDATDDFAGLRGEGDFSVTFDPDTNTGEEILTGQIHFHP